MKNIVILIASSLLLFSCIKNKTTTIEGILMTSCDTPAANTSGVIKTEDAMVSDGVSLPFTTDENGYFKVSYTGRDNLDKFRVIAGGSEVLSVWMLPGREKDLGKVYITPPLAKYYLQLIVNQSYTNNDTLTYSNGGWPHNGKPAWIKVPGPFTSGIIDTVHFSKNPTVMPLSHSHYTSGVFPTNQIGFYINQYNSEDLKTIEVPTFYCNEEYQLVTFVID